MTQAYFATNGQNNITSGYGRREANNSSSFHQGIDYVPNPAIGSTIYMDEMVEGVVAKVDFQPNGAGNWIYINKNNGEGLSYFHLDKIYVKVGQKVYINTPLGTSGNSGKTTGPHIHHERHRKSGDWNSHYNFKVVLRPTNLPISKNSMNSFNNLINQHRDDVRKAGVDIDSWWRSAGEKEFIYRLGVLGRSDVLRSHIAGLDLKQWYVTHGAKEYQRFSGNIWKAPRPASKTVINNLNEDAKNALRSIKNTANTILNKI